MLIGESIARNVVNLTAAGAVGVSALMGNLNACGNEGPTGAPEPVPTGGAEVRDGQANRCELILARSGENFTAHAQVNGSVPNGSELVYTVRYKATWQDGSHETEETRVPAASTITALGKITVDGKEREFFGVSGKIDLTGTRVNLGCGSKNLDDLPD
jgi:hypothetical protein